MEHTTIAVDLTKSVFRERSGPTAVSVATLETVGLTRRDSRSCSVCFQLRLPGRTQGSDETCATAATYPRAAARRLQRPVSHRPHDIQTIALLRRTQGLESDARCSHRYPPSAQRLPQRCS